MQQQNIREYQLMRQELLNIKNCMTTYIGFVLGGSGAALFGFVAISKGTDTFFNLLALAIAPLLTSLIISFVLYILIYKFTAHNRAAGYCKLLNHERYDSPARTGNAKSHRGDLFSWEICVDELRRSDFSAAHLLGLCERIELKGLDLEKLKSKLAAVSGQKPAVDRNKYAEGLKLLLRASTPGELRTKSWRFPVYVIPVFFGLCLIFLALGCAFTFYLIVLHLHGGSGALWAGIAAACILAIQFLEWKYYAGKFYALIKGSGTVDAFFTKLLPIRAHFLNNHDLTPNYILTDSTIA